MLSITKDMDEFDIAAEIRIERQVHKGSFLLLEGERDLDRFEGFIDDVECALVNCYGRPRLIGAIKLLYDDGFAGALGLADADFDRVLARLDLHEGIIYSTNHDFDVDMVRSGIIDRYLKQTADEAKCRAIGTNDDIIAALMNGIKPVSVARYLNERGNIKYRLKNIQIYRCINGINVDIAAYVDLIFEGRSPSEVERTAVETLIRNHSANLFDLLQITNGHDFFVVLGLALRDLIGSRAPAQTLGKEVELHFRMSFGEGEFKRTQVYAGIIDWERRNKPYIILKNDLRPPDPAA